MTAKKIDTRSVEIARYQT